jgi:transcription elongation factor/antiterminator RfaH
MPWYAIYTRPRHEKQVYEDLTNRNIEAFLPTYKVRRRWSDRYKIVEEPLFKNYLFVNVDYDRRYYETLRPYGAVAFVMFDDKPAEIPKEEIEAIRQLVTSTLPYDPHPYLKVGRKVRVRFGPLEGCEGVLVRKKGLARLVLSVHLLQQSVSAEVDSDTVEPL